MKTPKQLHIYTISRGYVSATVWSGSPSSSRRVSVSHIKVNSGLTRLERYNEIGRWLSERFDITTEYAANGPA